MSARCFLDSGWRRSPLGRAGSSLIVSLLLAAAMVIGLVPQSAVAGINDYPTSGAYCWAGASCNLQTAGSSVVDKWGFYARQCTSFVAWRMERDGHAISNNMNGGHFGDANHWDTNANFLDFPTSTTPGAGMVAQSDLGAFGHVAVVEAVSGSTVTVEDYNFTGTRAYGRHAYSPAGVEYLNLGGLPFGRDVIADGRGDLLALRPDGTGTDVYVLKGGASGYSGPTVWRDLIWNLSYVKPLSGDVNADGRADLIALRPSGTGTDVYVLLAGTSGYGGPTVWRSLIWNWDFVIPLAGDVNGDSRADLIGLRPNGSGTDVWVLLAGTSGYGAPSVWRNVAWSWGPMVPIMGDVNADGRKDLVVVRPSGSGSEVRVLLAGTSGFGAPGPASSQPWAWDENGTRVKPMVGDIDSNGKADLIAMVPDGGGTDVVVAKSTTTSFGAATVWRDLIWSIDSVKPFVANVNYDGRADLVALRPDGTGTNVYVLRGGASGFAGPELWRDLIWNWDSVKLPG